MVQFRFQDLEIWKMAIDIANKCFDIADELEKKRLFRFAEQLRGSGMSISNNIAEGSGSFSDREFSNFLNISRRSTFETANIIFILKQRQLIREIDYKDLFFKLEHLSKKITNFKKKLDYD